ncbi:PREDICTED: zinc finger B-box domain-containing protein 1 [Condylura cristata]|uniref:zinc finger B-box domain-containing protein 1 n=1 Tax=Condylura cristata TaxID=143302 RepID=UPI000334599E|nr:PREDICTED: zinc finger B-box domain-containing protein 1 [Condylura cristata]
MNTKDFVVLPWGKPGNSIKLRYKNAQELRMEKVQLELENQELEKKLQEFQSTRNKEKEERQSSGYHWKSGQVGKLGTPSHMMLQNKGNVIKFSSGKVKLKLLKQQLQETVKPPLNYKMTSASESEKSKIRGKVCGQCENKAALLAKSQILSSVLDVAHKFIKEVNTNEPKEERHSAGKNSKSQHKDKPLLLQRSSEVEVSTPKKGEYATSGDMLLCEGTFNEETSAQSFQEALNQWRNGHHDNKKHNLPAVKTGSLEECEVQTNLKIWREPLQIEFKEDSLSYMEKLWLKKHRRTTPEQLRNMLPDSFLTPCKTLSETQCSQNENDEDNDVEEIKVQHQALFLPLEELKIERAEPSLKIVELDNVKTRNVEEIRNVVPYKVELAVADSQQSCTFHDYQNNFLYKNDIFQHHVFTKGKQDFLHLHLSDSSSFCKDNTTGTSNLNFDNNVDLYIYSSATEKSRGNYIFEGNSNEKSIDKENTDSCMSLENKEFLPMIDLEETSIKKKVSEDIEESLDLSNLHERPNFENSKTAESPLLLREIALRNKPINERYQGLERFFVFDKNERLNSLPSHSLEHSYSSPTVTFTGQSPQKTSAANLPVPNSINNSSCLSSSHSPSRSIAVRSLSRAASEISEIEYVDITDNNEPFLDGSAEQETLDNLERELSMLRSLADPSEKLYNLTSEESPGFHNHSLNVSQTALELLNISCAKEPCEGGEESSSEKDTDIQCLLTLPESSSDNEDEDFLDNQQVIALPWSEST